MCNTLQSSSETVEFPSFLTDAQKRWRVVFATILSIMAFSRAREAVVENQGLELTPTRISARKRWRMACKVLQSIRAFSLARENESDNQNERRNGLLRSPFHMVINVEPECVIKLVQLKDIEQLNQFGGIKEVAAALGTDTENGIQGGAESIACRRKDFGSNTVQKPPPKILQIVFETSRDPMIIILTLCATLTLGFGIKAHGLEGWYDGGSIFVAVFLVIMVTASSNIWPRRLFFKLSRATDDFSIDVIRNGQKQRISACDVVVGDVVSLKHGDQIPADGLYIDGNSLQVDESNIKVEMDSPETKDSHNPFLLSGTKVTNGSAQMLVTAVGMNTTWGKTLSSSDYNSNQSTALQMKLHKLTMLIAKIGLVVASLVLLVLLIRYFMGNIDDDHAKMEFLAGKTRIHHVCKAVIGILATSIAIASAAIPEGLLLAFTITIAYSTHRMAEAQKALVRNLSACETIGSTTVICTNERGTLTAHDLKVSEFWFGKGTSSFIAPNVLELLLEGGVSNNTQVSSGSPTELAASIEIAIRNWAAVQDMAVCIEQERDDSTIQHPGTFNSEATQSIIGRKKKNENKVHMYQKGDPEVVLKNCSQYYDEHGHIKDITTDVKEILEQKILEMKSKGLHCIAFSCSEVSEENDDGNENFHPKLKEECFTLLGFVGLKYPCRPEVKRAVNDCQNAGLNIKVVTRSELLAAKATAIECGILEPNHDTGEVVEGPDFHNCTEEERLEKSDKIRVMARASTLHRLLMVQYLKQKGHVVAVTGDSIGDASVLKEANVGLSLGIQGTNIAKENSDIIILDDSFDSIATALRWGRGMYYKIQLYTQFQLTVSIASLVIDFVTAISARQPPNIKIVAAISAGKVPHATLQMLWVKLIVGALAALAITIEEPAEELRQLPSVNKDEPFITNIMWRNIVGQALYPIITLLTIYFRFNLDAGVKDTMIFNTFVLWQLFTIFTTKRFEINIIKGIRREKLFWTIIGTIIFLQVVIVELLKRFASTTRLNWMQWATCIGIAVLAWPIGWLLNRIDVPKKPFFCFTSSLNL